MAKLVLFNKPFGVLSQFSGDGSQRNLKEFLHSPALARCYPAGRLDKDSEGLLLLTDNGSLQQQISHPKNKWVKTYWVQVEGEISPDALRQLATGVDLKDGPTLPAQTREIPTPDVWERLPPIRERRYIPTSWLEIQLREGRNRQIRRMTAAVGYPTLRLLRIQIGEYQLGKLLPGEFTVFNVATPHPKPRGKW